MLVLGSRLVDTPVMSLQTGTRLARAGKAVIDPSNLKIMAYQVDGPLLAERPAFLRTADIRELGKVGIIIDSNDELVGQHDIIKLEKLYQLGFSLVGMPVIDQHRRKLGRVEDYTLDTKSFVIQQLHIRRGVLSFTRLLDTGLLVHRSQIVEINDQAVIVRSAAKKSAEPVMQASRHEYVNPFRSPVPTPEAEG